MARKKVQVGDGAWGSGSVRLRGAKWQVRWEELGARQSKGGYLSKAEAVEALGRILRNVQDGRPGVAEVVKPVPKAKGQAFPDLVPQWIESRRLADKTSADEDAARWEKHLAPALASHTLITVTPKVVRDLATKLVKVTKVSGPTAHRVLTLLSSFYQWAGDEELVATNPARDAIRHRDVKRLTRSTYDKDKRPYLKSWAQVDKLYTALKAVSPTVAIYYLVQARAGLRPGEVLGLTWADIDLDARTIYVERQVRAGKLGATKGRKARTVPIGETLARELDAWKASGKGEGLVCPPPSRVTKKGALGKAWGTYLGPKTIVPTWTTGLITAGLAEADVYDYGRRSFGSIMGLDPSVSVWRLQEIMGHASVTTTQRYVALRNVDLTAPELAALG